MTFLTYLNLSLTEFFLIIFIVFIASIIRGFNGFGFSATCISGFSFILPAIETVPIILLLEVLISIFMIPYIWDKIDWNFISKILIGIIIGSPIGLYLLKYLSPEIIHLYVCLIIWSKAMWRCSGAILLIISCACPKSLMEINKPLDSMASLIIWCL